MSGQVAERSQLEGQDFVVCKVCGRSFSFITASHLRCHGMSFAEYVEKFPESMLTSSKMSKRRADAQRGKKRCLSEVQLNAYAARRGIKQSKETCKKKSIAHTGKILSPEHVRHLQEAAARRRVIHPPKEPKPKYVMTEQHKAALRAVVCGRVAPEAEREKIRQSKLGKKRPPEFCASLSVIVAEGIANGTRKIRSGGKTGLFYSDKNKTTISYHSIYELFAFIKLEQDDMVLSFYRGPTLPYSYGGVDRHYMVDIRVVLQSDQTLLVEVKPTQVLTGQYQVFGNTLNQLQTKCEAAKTYCDNLGWRYVI